MELRTSSLAAILPSMSLSGREGMTEDEILAVHEAAHAVFAAFGEWTRVAGPVVLKGPGHGDVVMATDPPAIRRTLRRDHGFDRDAPRIELVRSLLAGPIAERMLAERGWAALSEADMLEASAQDYAVIAEQLGRLDPPRPGLLDRLERDVRRRLEEPAIWAAVERFAAILLERRSLEADEASAILERIRKEMRISPAEAGRVRKRALLGAFLLWEAWWAWEFLAAPRPDEEMRTIAAILFGLILPGLSIALVALILLRWQSVRRKPVSFPGSGTS